MANDPGWNESGRMISSGIARTLIKRLDFGPSVSGEDMKGALSIIYNVNLFVEGYLESNKPSIYIELQKVGVSEEDIRAIPLFEGYDPEAR